MIIALIYLIEVMRAIWYLIIENSVVSSLILIVIMCIMMVIDNPMKKDFKR